MNIEKKFKKFVRQIYGKNTNVYMCVPQVIRKDDRGLELDITAHAIHNFALYLKHTHQIKALCIVNSWRNLKDML